MKMNAYMVYDKDMGSEEGACLVIHHSEALAASMGSRILNAWWDRSPDSITVARLLSEPNEEARKLIALRKAIAVECPVTCSGCEQWGEELYDGYCGACEGERAANN